MNLKQILKKQNKNGSFSINGKTSQLYTAIIANILLQEKTHPEILDNICQYFLENKSPAWTFNIYTNKAQILPDDLFTSSLVWYNLYKYKPELLKTEDLAQITQTLTLLETQEGGPYQNWLVAPTSSKKWLKTKYSSNKILQAFLKLLEIDLDNLNKYLQDSTPQNDYIPADLYKFLLGQNNNLEKQKCQFPNDIELNLDLNITIKTKNENHKNEKTLKTKHLKYIENIKKLVFDRLNKAGENMSEATKPLINKIFNNKMGKVEIVLFPTLFTNLFPKTDFSEKLLKDLSLANFWCWLAYTIYDDFLDNEGNIQYLSTANLALRECTKIYNNLQNKYSDLPIKNIFHQMMDTIDNANTWETINCRFDKNNPKELLKKELVDYKNFQILHQRSIAQALSPLTLTLIAGYKENSSEYKNLYQFIKHYLIAKQLNDDCHDFQKDFQAGQLNSVINEAIIDLKKQQKEKITFNQENIYQYFINKSLEKIVKIIQQHIKEAKKHINIFETPLHPLLEKTLDNLSNSAQKALEEQKETQKFINEYENLHK